MVMGRFFTRLIPTNLQRVKKTSFVRQFRDGPVSLQANHVDSVSTVEPYIPKLSIIILNYCFSSGSSKPQKDSAFIPIQPCFPPVGWIVKTAPSQKSMSLVCCWFYLHFYADFSKFVFKPFESLKISATFLGSYIVSHPAPLTATKQVSYIMAGPRGAQAN